MMRTYAHARAVSRARPGQRAPDRRVEHTVVGGRDLDVDVGAVDVVIMIIVQCILLVASMGVAWALLGLLNFDKKLRVMGLFGCTHKTVAMGVPLITAIYEGAGQPLGLYLLPLLVWHPSQLVIGSFLAPRLLKWVGPPSESSGDLSV